MAPFAPSPRTWSVVSRTALLAWLAAGGMAGQGACAAEQTQRAQQGRPALVKVDKAWVRPAVKGQNGTGGFMDLTASRDLTLTGFRSSAATDSELHEMAMDAGGVMRMRPVDSLALPAGKTVSLSPGMGGHHLMLMGLKRPLKAGDKVELTLELRAPDGKPLSQKVVVPVRQVPSSSAGEMPHDHGHDHGQHHHHE